MKNLWLKVGAILGALFVILGALLQHYIPQNSSMFSILAKAQQYHMLHLIALLAVGILLRNNKIKKRGIISLNIAGILFFIGMLLFSGNLYLKAISSSLYIVSLVPIGGSMFIFAWLLFFSALF